GPASDPHRAPGPYHPARDRSVKRTPRLRARGQPRFDTISDSGNRRNARISSVDRIEKAFRTVRRADFVIPELREEADVDAPLPIRFGQTISPPTTVKFMLSWLDAMLGDEVLDVGSGSGWTTALLAHIVGPQGIVY